MKFTAITLALSQITPAPMPEVASWEVNTSDVSCTLIRNFNTPQGRVSVGFRPFFNQPTIDLVIASPLSSRETKRGSTVIAVPSIGQSFQASYYSYPSKKGSVRFTEISTQIKLWEEFRRVDGMSISLPVLKLDIPTAKNSVARKTFRKCEDDLLLSWGVSRTLLEPETLPISQVQDGWFDAPEIPRDGKGNPYIGRVISVLNIDASGKVVDCRVVSTGPKPLNAAVCRMLQGIKYTPAKDKDGVPVPSIDIVPMRWGV